MATKYLCLNHIPSPPIKTIHNIEDHFEIPNVLVCFRAKKNRIDTQETDCKKFRGDKKDNPTELKPSKSRELRASILYVGCDCEKRNGLQDQCQRLQCYGSPACLTIPPTCPPSQFANGKHIQKMYEQRMKEIAAAKKRLAEKEKQKFLVKQDDPNCPVKDKHDKGKDKHSSGKTAVDYECYPLEYLQKGDSCPICSKPMSDKVVKDVRDKKHEPNVHIGPLNISVPKKCICCQDHH